jgi:hypothetical protein
MQFQKICLGSYLFLRSLLYCITVLDSFFFWIGSRTFYLFVSEDRMGLSLKGGKKTDWKIWDSSFSCVNIWLLIIYI